MMTLSDFLSRLTGVEHRGNGQYVARCPCHDDKRASLSVAMGQNGIVLKCFAGCDYMDILERLGVSWKDMLTPEKLQEMASQRKGAPPAKRSAPKPRTPPPSPVPSLPPPQAKRPADLDALRVGGEWVHKATMPDGTVGLAREKITACYNYVDAEGRPLLKVFRTEEKSFPVIHQDGGQWYWGDGGRHAILYNLPQVTAAIKANKPIYLVEGEKDCDTLMAMERCATTNKGGAGKWSAELSEQLRGARVYIIPDLDEPGRKHARLVAKSLAPTAREVRIINLARQQDATLPPKGDISDLVAILAPTAAGRVLDELVKRAPVLSRTVGDEDYKDYFEAIPGCLVENGCTLAVAADGTARQLANFVALPVVQTQLDDGFSTPKYQLTIRGWSATGQRLTPLTVGVADFLGMQWATQGWGLCANISDINGSAGKLRRIIQEAGSRAASDRVLYKHTGWRDIGGQMVYLHGGGGVGAEDAEVQLDFGLGRYRLDGLQRGDILDTMEPETRRMMCQGATLRVMKAPGLRIGAAVVGFLFLAPLRYFLDLAGRRPTFVPYIMGASGYGKSAYVTLALNHYGYDWSYDGAPPASFEDSMPAMSQKLFELKDMPLLIDDYKRESDPLRQRARKALVEMVIRAMSGAQRSVMISSEEARSERPPRCLCLMTGEELPDVTASSIARLYVVEVHEGEVPVPKADADPERTKEINALWRLAREGALNESMRGYIEWLSEQGAALPERLEASYTELLERATREVESPHPRMPSAVAYLMLGIQMMCQYMTSAGGVFSVAPEAAEELQAACWRALLEGAMQQSEQMQADSPTTVFLLTLRELLNAGRCVLADLGLKQIQQEQIKPLGLVGYKDAENIYLIPGEAYGAVQRSLETQGSSLNIGKNSLLRELLAKGISRPSAAGKTLQQINRGPMRGCYLVIPRYVMDNTAPPVREEQATFLPVTPPDNPFGGDRQ